MYLVFEMLGIIAFAISGSMVAIEEEMDIVGVVTLGVTTAVGGGIIRDVLIGVTPPTSLIHPVNIGVALIVSFITFIRWFRQYINLNSMFWVIVDAMGLGIFTAVGIKTALPFENIWLQLFLGVLTGVGGGVLRDVFAAQKPIVFVKHFYALASLCGAILCTILLPFGENIATVSCIVLVVVLRVLAAKYKWEMPKAR